MKKIVLLAFCAVLGIITVIDAAGVTAAAASGARVCLEIIVPSLFAPMVLSSFLIKSGVCGNESAVFALSLVGGYPVGMVLLADNAAENPNFAKRAEKMLMYCYCGSPVFIIALAGKTGMFIWLSNALACIVIAIFANIKKTAPVAETRKYGGAGKALVDGVTSSGRALYQVCLMVVLFAVLLEIARFAGIKSDVFRAFAEISNIHALNAPAPLLAAFTSFGGVCVLFQAVLICGGRIKLGKFFAARVPAMLISAGICELLFPLMNTSVSVWRRENVAALGGGNVIASVCLLAMAGILLFEKEAGA